MSTKDKATGFVAEFKKFIARGNVVDMAVGVVIGGAFGKISTSIVNDIIMPVVSILTGGIDFTAWKIVLKQAIMEGETVVKPEIAITFGNTISVIVDFIIVAFAIFCMIKAMNAFRAKEEEPAPAPAPEPEPEPIPEPSAEEKLLTEIRDLLKNK